MGHTGESQHLQSVGYHDNLKKDYSDLNWTLNAHVKALASATESQSGGDVSEVKRTKVFQIAAYGMISTRKDRTPVHVYLDNAKSTVKWLSQASCSRMRGEETEMHHKQSATERATKLTIAWKFCAFYCNLDASARVVLRKKATLRLRVAQIQSRIPSLVIWPKRK